MMRELNLDKQASDLLPAGFDPIESMRILTDYLSSLEIAYDELIKKSGALQRQNEASLRSNIKAREDLEQEKDRLTSDLLVITNQVEELESSLLSANQKVGNFEKQIKKLHRENGEMETRLAQRENDTSFFKSEVERLTKDYDVINSNLSGANNRVDELERKLASERNVIMTHEKESRHLASSLSEAQGKNQILEQKLSELTTLHSEEIKKLNERLNSDSKHEVNLLKKRVKTALGPEIRDLDKISSDKLSTELASNLKALINRLISKLEQTGFELKSE